MSRDCRGVSADQLLEPSEKLPIAVANCSALGAVPGLSPACVGLLTKPLHPFPPRAPVAAIDRGGNWPQPIGPQPLPLHAGSQLISGQSNAISAYRRPDTGYFNTNFYSLLLITSTKTSKRSSLMTAQYSTRHGTVGINKHLDHFHLRVRSRRACQLLEACEGTVHAPQNQIWIEVMASLCSAMDGDLVTHPWIACRIFLSLGISRKVFLRSSCLHWTHRHRVSSYSRVGTIVGVTQLAESIFSSIWIST